MRRLLLIVVLLAALGGAAWLVLHHGAAPTQRASRHGRGAGGPVPVMVADSARQDVPIWLNGLGTVQAFNTVTVHSMIDGPLLSVDFKEGQDVTAGEVLARIDPRPYQAALDQAVAKKAQDQANLANAKLDLTRYEKLARTNYTTQQQADTQRATVKELEAQVEQDEAAIETARTNLSYTTIASPLSGRTGIRQLDPGNIIHTTDTNGLVTITQLHPIWVVFTLPQQQLGPVRAAMQAGPVQVLALPQGATNEETAPPPGAAPAGPGLTASATGSGAAADPPGDPAPTPPTPTVLDRGVLAVLDNQVDSATGTIKMKAQFPNPALKLWPGGFVDVQLLVRTERGVVTVPPAAVQRGPNGAFVYVVHPDDTAHRVAVNVGAENQQVAVIASGVEPGQQVVTDGAERVTDGGKVTIVQPESESGAPAGAAHTSHAPGTASRHRHRHQPQTTANGAG